MKQGVTFSHLLERVEQEAASRRDFYVPTPEMHLMTDETSSRLATPCGQFDLRDTAHLHLAELTGIDRRYYQRMRTEAPFLLDRNVNHWLATNPPKQRIVRAQQTDTGAQARAIVSSRYAILDNDALLRTVEPVIAEQGLTIESCDVSEERMTIKMISPRLTGDVKVGDTVQAGLIVRNSEVRCNAVEVNWFVKRLVCLNGMVVTGPHGRGAQRRHVGRDWSASRRKSQNRRWHGGNSYRSDAHRDDSLSFGLIPENMAREEWERDIWEQLQVSLRESLNTTAFTNLLERLALTTRLHTRLGPEQVAERVGSAFHLRPSEQIAMLCHLARDEDMSLWGVVNAVTRTAQDVEDYARATDLEELGGHLAHLTPREWDRLVSPN
jgi:Domain of unknown function (DUF932)